MDPQWLQWANRLQALAQNGLTYNTDPFDRDRYQAVRTIAHEILAAHTDAQMPFLADLYRDEVGHATPKVDVRGVVFDGDGKVLLVRERSDGCWSLPGGWADVYDSPGEATVREIWEESGYRTRATRLLALFDRTRHEHPPMPFHVYKLFFRCELEGGSPTESVETDGAGFFAEDDLPPLSIGRTTPAQLRRFFEHWRNPDLPTDFD